MRTAQLYMKLADYLADGDPAKAQRVADSSLREVGALLLDEKNTHEETRKKLLKKELTEAFSQSWMTSGPMERRALMVLFGLRKIGPRKEHLRFLRWLNKHDENGRIAGTPELQNAGLDTGRLIETIKLDPKRHVTASEARELFELAGKPSATLAAVMFENGYFDLEAGVMIPEAFRN